jgi:hypothetical protein
VLSWSGVLLSRDRHPAPIRVNARHHVTDLCDRQEFCSSGVLLAKNDAGL